MIEASFQWDQFILLVAQVVYFLSAFFLNLFLFMIGNFYRKKLGENMFLAGFVVSMLALVVALVGTIVGDMEYGRIITGFALVFAGGSTLANGSVIYYAMKRAHR